MGMVWCGVVDGLRCDTVGRGGGGGGEEGRKGDGEGWVGWGWVAVELGRVGWGRVW